MSATAESHTADRAADGFGANAIMDPTLGYEQNLLRGPGPRWLASERWRRHVRERAAASGTGGGAEPRHSFLGVPVWSLFGMPAGPLLNAAYVAAAFRNGFDVNVYKTVRSTPVPAHPAPNILAVHPPSAQAGAEGHPAIWRPDQNLLADARFAEPLSICNSFGVPSASPDEWQPDMRAAVAAASPGQLLIASFQATRREGVSGRGSDRAAFIADHAATARLVAQTGAPVLELDASCPNEGGGLLCFDPATLADECEAIRSAVPDRPLGVKIARFADDTALLAMLQAVGNMVDSVACINTLPARLVNAAGDQALPGLGRDVAGVCGAAILPAALDMVARVRRLRDELGLEFAIVGIGGCRGPMSALRLRAAGADLVMSATAAMRNPNLAEQVVGDANEVA